MEFEKSPEAELDTKRAYISFYAQFTPKSAMKEWYCAACFQAYTIEDIE